MASLNNIAAARQSLSMKKGRESSQRYCSGTVDSVHVVRDAGNMDTRKIPPSHAETLT